ncbi:MAG: hypothetical protein AABX66_03490 [Nanoarchaeota archaeon]
MKFDKGLVSLVAFFALALLFVSFASASTAINSVEVSGVETLTTTGNGLAVFAGQSLPVKVVFTSTVNMSDVRVKAWISGDQEYAVSSDRFDVLATSVYSKFMSVQAPSNIDPAENLKLEISVESKTDGEVAHAQVSLATQRESYTVEILSVAMDPTVNAGSNIPIDLVLKNRGMHFAEDTFVKASIPILGIERKAYFGDLSPVDQGDNGDHPANQDAAERTMLLSIPAGAPAGIYTVQIEAYNADSSSVVTKKIAVVGASGDSRVVSSAVSKTFAVGDKASYSVTLVNSGNQARVYDVSFEAPADLTVSADETVFVVPAGSSKTVKVEASADKAGTYSFVVNLNSDGELVKKQSFEAQVKGSSVSGVNTTVVLTVILAIVFVVLLVVLIVLLTRKPQKTEEFGESYY